MSDIVSKYRRYVSTYGTARAIARMVAFFGWLTVLGAVLMIFVSLYQEASRKEKPKREPDATTQTPSEEVWATEFVFKVMWASVALMGGLIQVGLGQLIRAVVDTADNTGNAISILKDIRSKLAISQIPFPPG